jgi:hypothetical protein
VIISCQLDADFAFDDCAWEAARHENYLALSFTGFEMDKGIFLRV